MRAGSASERAGLLFSPDSSIEVGGSASSGTPSSDPACDFCQIVRGDRPAYRVHEEDHLLAFLDRRPLFPGHCLLIPRGHHETLMDLPRTLAGPLMETTQRLARAVQTGMEADGVFVAVNNRISQSVPHLHVHVVPRRRRDGLRGFFWPRQRYADDAHAAQVARSIAAALTRLTVSEASP